MLEEDITLIKPVGILEKIRQTKYHTKHIPQSAGVYKITNRKTGKVYVGSSKDIYKRIKQHSESLHLNKHSNPELQADFNVCGIQGFSFDVVQSTVSYKIVEAELLIANDLSGVDTYNNKGEVFYAKRLLEKFANAFNKRKKRRK